MKEGSHKKSRKKFAGVEKKPGTYKYKAYIYVPTLRKPISVGTFSTIYEAAKARHIEIMKLPEQLRRGIVDDYIPDTANTEYAQKEEHAMNNNTVPDMHLPNTVPMQVPPSPPRNVPDMHLPNTVPMQVPPSPPQNVPAMHLPNTVPMQVPPSPPRNVPAGIPNLNNNMNYELPSQSPPIQRMNNIYNYYNEMGAPYSEKHYYENIYNTIVRERLEKEYPYLYETPVISKIGGKTRRLRRAKKRTHKK